MTKGLESRYFNLREEKHQMNSNLDELSCSRLHFIQSAMSLIQLVETDRRCWTSGELGRQKPLYIPVSHRRKDASADHAWQLWLRGQQCIEEKELVPGLSLGLRLCFVGSAKLSLAAARFYNEIKYIILTIIFIVKMTMQVLECITLLKVTILIFHNLEKVLVRHAAAFHYKKSTDN